MKYIPKLPKILQGLAKLRAVPAESSAGNKSTDELAKIFPSTHKLPLLKFAPAEALVHQPLRVGVVLSGGQAAGGHNVITGIFDALKSFNSASRVFGFLNGPAGIIENKYIEITKDRLDLYRNQGGFDMIGSGRTKIETLEQFQASENNVKALDLDGLVVIGGDDSNTNAALLAEYFIKQNCKTKVIGVPKTIDGDLKNEFIETSFGFDTACKTYSEIIGNVLRDSLSAGKYYFFIKLMGRSASHIALECALQTHTNMTLIGEEVEAKRQTLNDITNAISDMICERADQGKDYGVVLIPEGIIEFIPECKTLIGELNAQLVADKPHLAKIESLSNTAEKTAYMQSQLTPGSAACMKSLPLDVQAQLLLDRDPHGNVQVSKIESDRLFMETVKKELKSRQKAGKYRGKFSGQPLFCGYEGRSCLPSNFDAQYCYALGYVAALLIDTGVTGYMSCVQQLTRPVEEWQIGGIPLVSMMNLEQRKGKLKPVIRKALVDLQGRPFALFEENREKWKLADDYRYPGPIQFFGPAEVTEAVTYTLQAESD